MKFGLLKIALSPLRMPNLSLRLQNVNNVVHMER